MLRKRLSPSEWNMQYMHLEFFGVTMEEASLILEVWAMETRDAGRKRLSRTWPPSSQRAFLLILEGAGQAHWFPWRTILGLDCGRLDLILGCVGYPAADSLFSHATSSVLAAIPHWTATVLKHCCQWFNVQHPVCTSCTVPALGELLASASWS